MALRLGMPRPADAIAGNQIAGGVWYRFFRDTFLRLSEMAFPLTQPYAPGAFTVPTEHGAVMVSRLTPVDSERATLVGTARLRII